MLETAPEVERREDPGQLYVWPECWRRLEMPLQHQQPKCFIHVEGEEKVTPVAEKGKGGDESKSNAKEVDMIVNTHVTPPHPYPYVYSILGTSY